MEWRLPKLAWLLVLANQAASFCPPFMAQERACTCFAYLDGAVVKCKGPSATAAVEKLKAISAEIRELSIEDANIVEVGPRAFRNLRVKSLILDNNHIRSIHADAFRGLEDTLVTLSLAHNRLSEVPTDALTGMNSLLVLNLKCNSIGNLYNSAFRNVSRLIELNLGCNQICKIAGPAFETVKETVQSLVLDQNCLQEIPAEALRNFKQLLALHLQYNAITSIEKLQLMNLVSLLMIRLTGNKIRSIDRYGFNNVPNLRYLFLDQNELVAVEPNTLQQFKFLEILDLSYNNIAEITAGAFNGLEHLLQLNLEGNTIKDIAPGAFANSPLLLLLLGSNCLSAVNQQMFQGVPFLRQLSLTNNNIRLIQPFSFNGLPNAHMLDLSSNKIQNVQPTAITINPQTTVLLQENPMACTQGGYHIIQGGQPTMLLNEPNEICKREKDDSSNSTALEEDKCPTRKAVPSAPACCSATSETAFTAVTSSVERLLHQSTPFPQKSILDLGSLVPSLGKTGGIDSTTPSLLFQLQQQQNTSSGDQSNGNDNSVKFSSNRGLNMERFWRFTAAPRGPLIAPGIRAVPVVTSPASVTTSSKGSSASSGKENNAGEDEESGVSARPRIVPAGDDFENTGLVTEGGHVITSNIHKTVHHPSSATEQSQRSGKDGQQQGKQSQIQFSEDEQSQNQPNLSVLPNIRQPLGGVNFQGLQQPNVQNGQHPLGSMNGQQSRLPPQGQRQSPAGLIRGPNGQVLGQLRQNSRSQQQRLQQAGQSVQEGGSSNDPASRVQSPTDAQSAQQRPQFSFGQPIPQGSQGSAPQFQAQPPRLQGQSSSQQVNPPQGRQIQGQAVRGQGSQSLQNRPIDPEVQTGRGPSNPQLNGSPQGPRIRPVARPPAQSSPGAPSVQPPASPHPPSPRLQDPSPVSDTSGQPESSTDSSTEFSPTVTTASDDMSSPQSPWTKIGHSTAGPQAPATNSPNAPSGLQFLPRSSPGGIIHAPAQMPPGIHPPAPPQPPGGAPYSSGGDQKPKTDEQSRSNESQTANGAAQSESNDALKSN